MNSLHFIRPYWLIMIIPAFFYGLIVIYKTKQKNPWKAICDPHLLPAIVQYDKQKSQWLIHGVLFLFMLLACIALSGPAWHKIETPIYRNIASEVIVLDLSPAMLTNDILPDRINRARYKIRDLINESHSSQMGLVVFSEEAFVASPLSQDVNTLTTIVDELNPEIMPVSGSDMSQGLMKALDLFKQTNVSQGNIILITASEPTANAWKVANSIKEAGHQLNIFAMQKPDKTTEKNLQDLEQLAKTGGGILQLFTPDNSDILAILKQNKASQIRKDLVSQHTTIWQDMGPWFCLLLLPFALILWREKT